MFLLRLVVALSYEDRNYIKTSLHIFLLTFSLDEIYSAKQKLIPKKSTRIRRPATSRLVRWQTAIWCEPEFFSAEQGGLCDKKNSGWQIALIFCLLFHQGKSEVS
jgi:hypothetical protein